MAPKSPKPSPLETAAPAPDSPENLDKVRDILFGGHMRAVAMRRQATGMAAVVRLVGPLVALAALAVGCGPSPQVSHAAAPAAGRVTVITEAEIVRMGARTAWDAVRLKAPYLVFGTGEAGRPTDVRIQAPRSANADETPLLVIDGVQMTDLTYLNQLSATEVQTIWILDAEAAQPQYGLRAAGGAIVVRTRMGR
jgi:hypothetical protein